MAVDPPVYELFRRAERSALHLELRDVYQPKNPDWQEWRSGRRFDPAVRWRGFHELIQQTTARGVRVRRARIVSEPVSDYIRFEYDVTAAHNITAGEDVRWLARHRTAGLVVPPADFWVFDDRLVLWNHFDGDGSWIGEERVVDPGLAALCVSSFDAVWDRAIPHADYRPA